MDLNPYRAQHESAVAALATAVAGLQEQYELYGLLHRFDEAQVRRSLKLAETKLETMTLERDQLGIAITAALLAAQVPRFYYRHRSLVGRVIDGLTGKSPTAMSMSEAEMAENARRIARVEALRGQIDAEQGLVTALRYDLQFHSTLDWLETDTDYATFRSQITRLEPAVKKLAVEVARFDEHLVEPLQKRDELCARLHEAERGLAEATLFDEQYQKAPPDSSERNAIKGQCQRYFGLEDTNRVRQQKKHQVTDLKRELTKAEERLRTLLQRDLRVVDQLVIDGNNLCNSGRGKNHKFIGLSALVALIPVLQASWPGCEIIVVFDPGITGKLRLTWEEVQRHFPASVDTHLVARGQSADEAIVELAKAPNAFIISNDRFVEFSNRPPVKEHRVFGHDITRTTILVKELWISVKYSSSANVR